ncbi:hypothetical protein [Actinoplanes regularis]|uniref:hypothetical protein n=1 Tax=Actinoplanes regularis TaxID=52697 RepID=UPI00255626E0|nr:hypothetical protein [Actinoplanes regularis]
MPGTPSAAGTAATRVATSAALVSLTLLLTTSCTDKPAKPTAAPASSAPSVATSPSTNAEEAEAREKVLAAYDGYRKAYVAAAAIPDTSGGKLRDFAADPLLSLIRADLQTNAEQGYILKGKPAWTVKVVNVNVAKRPFTAETEECFDSTNWKLVKRSTGKPAAVPGQTMKYLVTGEAAQFDDGRWLIRVNEAHRDQPC